VTSKWAKGTGGPAGDEHYNMVVRPRSDVDWKKVEGLQQNVGTLCSDTHPGAYSWQDAYTGRLVPHEVQPVACCDYLGTQGGGVEVGISPTLKRKDGVAVTVPVCATGPVTHTLDLAHGATEDGTGRGTPIVPAVAFNIYPGQPTEGGPAQLHAKETTIANAVTVTEYARTTDRGTRVVQAQPTHIGALQVGSLPDTLALEDLNHADATQANAREVLRAVLKEIGAEAFTAWGIGVAASLQSTEVLQPTVHGEGVFSEAAEKSFLECVSLPLAADGSAWTLRGLWEAGCARRSPCRWGSHEQRHQELAAYLSGLSYQGASWRQVVQVVQQAVEGSRILRNALPEVQEVGRSDNREGQPVRSGKEGHGVQSEEIVRCLRVLESVSREWLLRETRAASPTRKVELACRRLTPTETLRLQAFPDGWNAEGIDKQGRRVKLADGPRYKQMGNAVTVNVAHAIAERVAAALRKT
jgi:hypothetical protein